MALPQADIDILRALAESTVRIAEDPVNLERKVLWYRHNACERVRPMVLAEIAGVNREILPETILQCTDKWARGIEYGLRWEICQFEVLKDDHVVEPWINTKWKVTATQYVDESELRVFVPKTDGKRGAKRWDGPLQNVARDFHKLKPRQFSVDRTATLEEKERLEKVFQGIRPIHIRGSYWWTMGMTWTAIDLVGLQNLMLFMYDDPDGLHRVMQFVFDDFVAYTNWLEREGLLSLNNRNDYIGSGSMGYTNELPRQDGRHDGLSGVAVRNSDLWTLLESQETVGVGPEQFERFIFPYQQKMAERFGLVYYGCCEPVHNRLHILKRISNLRSVSVSPWADEERMAEALSGKYVYSRKPNPSLLSTEVFDEEAIRQDIRRTLSIARDCTVEIIMKDLLSLNNQPDRLPRWVQIVREETDRQLGGWGRA